MIAIDTSALLAIVFGEAEREAFLEIIRRSPRTLVSAPTVVEARMVVHGRYGQRSVVLLDDFLREPLFEMISPDAAQTNAAYAAFVAYGRGSGHPAALNFGDLFSYALAKVRGLPLLFKGNDFLRTDIAPAWRAPH